LTTAAAGAGEAVAAAGKGAGERGRSNMETKATAQGSAVEHHPGGAPGGFSAEEVLLASHKAAIWSQLQSIPVMVAVSRHEVYLGRMGQHRWGHGRLGISVWHSLGVHCSPQC
jgi:hypothetical protein